MPTTTEQAHPTVGRARETVVCGTSIVWGDMGTGPPLVLLHGLGDSHRSWRRVAPILSRHFRVLMPDLPGHGWSGRPDAPYTLAWYAQMVADWMECLHLRSAHIGGHSFGGGIALWMLLDCRSRVDRLALVAPGGLGRKVSMGLRLATVPLLGRALTPPTMWLGASIGLRFVLDHLGHMEPDEARLVIRMVHTRGSARAFRRSLAGVINPSGQYVRVLDRAHEITSLPAMALFWGTEDSVLPIRHGQDLLQRTAGASLTTFPGCGHFPQLDAPEALARGLSSFFRDVKRRPAVLRPVASNLGSDDLGT